MKTIATMFWDGVSRRDDAVIFRQKSFGLWQETSWRQLGEQVRQVSMGLLELGFAPGEVASVLGNTRQEWMVSDLGILCAGGVSSGIYPTDAPAQVEYLLADSASVYLLVEDEEQLDKALTVRAALPSLRKIIVWDMKGLRQLDDPQVLSLEALCALGRARQERLGAAAAQAEWEARLASRRSEDLAILIYTSGTTGRPKGAMISHYNLMFTLDGINHNTFRQSESDERMCFLPLCHVAERVLGGYLALYTGTRLNFVENPETIPENVREISPTVFLAVPRIWEKFYSGVTIALSEANAVEQWAYRLALGVGMKVVARLEADSPIGGGLRLAHWLARFLVLDNVRKLIGIHRARLLITGAAPISPDLLRWYMALGLTMIEGWGQTESCGAGTINPLQRVKPGTIGTAADFNEVALSAEGELLIRGGNVFMGYLNQPEKTAETVDAEGWLHTGDVGRCDEDGYFKISDRMKDIIITAGGKNITPSEIENQLKFSPYITDAVVIGDRKPYLVCLVMIDQDNVEKFAQDHDIPFSNYLSLTRAPEVLKLIEAEVAKVNQQFARVEQIKKFRLIEQKLTAEDEELTPTMKLKRKFVERKYAAMIDSMYRS